MLKVYRVSFLGKDGEIIDLSYHRHFSSAVSDLGKRPRQHALVGEYVIRADGDIIISSEFLTENIRTLCRIRHEADIRTNHNLRLFLHENAKMQIFRLRKLRKINEHHHNQKGLNHEHFTK